MIEIKQFKNKEE